MSPRSWRYYVREIAAGREDYYAHNAERSGKFVGRGAEMLGIAHREADALALERLFGHGANPRSGVPLGRGFDPDNERAVAGFALTFSPPKSVSVLWALGNERASAEVLAAHEAAVAASLSFVEQHAAFTRRGHNGTLQVDTDGLLAAAFVHRTSRAADPQLHTHLLVANKVRAEDVVWLALDGRELFATQKATGMLYKAALRAELTQRLAVEWTAVDDNGVAEIEGVPQRLIAHWSARRQQVKATGDGLIANRAAELGRSLTDNERAECFQIAAYRTRTPKIDADTPTEQLRGHWRAEAEAWGLSPENWTADVLRPRSRVSEMSADQVAATVIPRLEERGATWTRSDVVEEVARLVDGGNASTVRERVDALADFVLGDAEVLNLAGPLPDEEQLAHLRRDGMRQTERHGATRFTTRTTLAREAAILEMVAAGRNANAAVVDADRVDRVLAASTLGKDQLKAVRDLVTGGERVALLVGPAGAGKSRALEAAGRCWWSQSFEPIGLAPSAMAAQVLRDEAGLRSDTLAKFLYDFERGQSKFIIDHHGVVVLDEAGMARSDDLAKLLAIVEERGAKAVLVGDPQQLGAVGPGGIFHTLVADHGARELETVRRFHHAWEAAASLHLRNGNTAILDAYDRHIRLDGGSRAEMIDRAFAAWRTAFDDGEYLLLMAGDNATADELSRRCRAVLVAEGYVGNENVPIANGSVSSNDRIVTLHNDRRIKTSRGDYVRNGSRWLVIDAASNGTLYVSSLDHAGRATLPAEYVAEHVALGYALTVHKAQGKTEERAALLVDEHLSAAQLYVGMSRGREENRAFVVCSEDDPDEHGKRAQRDAYDVMRSVMRRGDGNESAHDVMRRNFEPAEIALQEVLKRVWPRGPHRQRSEPRPARDEQGPKRRTALDPAERAILSRLRRPSPSNPPPLPPPNPYRGARRER
jgi:conjugative relaxase-like TrwC/TraI family protein